MELCCDGVWRKGTLRISDAFDGTSIAAVAFRWNNQPEIIIRVYYQAEDLSLREYCHEGGKWFQGQFVSVVQPHPSEQN